MKIKRSTSNNFDLDIVIKVMILNDLQKILGGSHCSLKN